MMKKNLLNLVMALCMGAFASCSQEEVVNSVGGDETVTLTAQLAEDAASRSLPSVVEGHQLRCILEVWDKTKTEAPLQRIEKLVSEGSGDKLQFRFSVGSGVDYQCLLWADYIATTDASNAEIGYADKYYNTQNLKAVGLNVTDSQLFNNPGTDAFCGKADKNGQSNLSVTLKRPFTKVTLKDKSSFIEKVNSLGVNFDAPSGYDISTEQATSVQSIAASDITVDAENKTFFSAFIFAAADASTLQSDIAMTFATSEGNVTKTIKSGQIKLDRNNDYTAVADYSTGGDVNVDVDIDGDYTEKNTLKIGQYVNKDGSVSDAFDADKVIGIVFAVGAQGDDAVADYGEAFQEKKIAGYAMALSCVAGKPFIAEPAFSQEIDQNLASWKGYSQTQTIIAYAADSPLFVTAFNSWKENNVLEGSNLSGWYVPSFQQLATFVGYMFGTPGTINEGLTFPEGVVKNDAFVKAVADANAGEFATGSKNVVSVSAPSEKKLACVQIKDNSEFVSVLTPGKMVNAVVMRPVLTIFK